LYQTAVNGKPTPSAGTLKTIMAGLACREASPAAWKVLDRLASDYVAIPDSWSSHAMTTLADGAGDVPIVSGESAAAGGLGVLLKATEDPELRGKLGLNEASRVVLFGGEGATDPQNYAEIVGCSADEVFQRQRALEEARPGSRSDLVRTHTRMRECAGMSLEPRYRLPPWPTTGSRTSARCSTVHHPPC